MFMVNFKYPSLFRNQIVTMSSAPKNDLVTTICDNVLSLTASQRDAILNNRWYCIAEFQGFNYDRMQTWDREINRLPESRGGCYFGSVVMAKLQGLAYW